MSIESLFSMLNKLSGDSPLERVTRQLDRLKAAASQAASLDKVVGQLAKLDAPTKVAEKAITRVNSAFTKVQKGTDDKSAKIRRVLESTGDVIEGRFGKKAAKTFRHFAEGKATMVDWSKAGSAAVEKLQGVATAAWEKIASLATAAGDLAVSGAKYALQMASFKQNTQFAWRYALGSGEAASKTFGYAVKIASVLGQDVEEVSAAMKEAFAAGVNQDQAERMVQMVADIKAMGGKAEVGDLVGVLKAMKKGQGLTEDLLAPLTTLGGDAGSGAQGKVFATLAKTLGITSKNAEQRKRDVIARLGELKGQRGIEAFQNAFKAVSGEGDAGDVAKKFADTTLEGSFNKIKNNFKLLFTKIDSEGAGSGLVKLGQKIADALNPDSKSGAKLLATIDKISATAGRLFDKIDIDRVVVGFGMLADVVDAAIGPIEAFGSGLLVGLSDALDPIMRALGSAEGKDKTLEKVSAALGTFGRALGYVVVYGGAAIAGLLTLPVIVFDSIGSAFDSADEWITEKINGIADGISSGVSGIFTAAAAIGTALASGIRSGLQSTWDGLVAKLNELVGMLPESVRNLLGIHSPSRVFAQLGAYTVQGFAQGVEDEGPSAREATVSQLGPRALGMGKAGAGAGAGGRPISVSVVNNIEGSKDPEAVRQAAEEGTMAGVQRILEAIALETGVDGAAA